ncbi:MAG: hypothetical protein ACJA1C_003255 [Crocinitomicaceae bacterium]|jgi:hypothetical protein
MKPFLSTHSDPEIQIPKKYHNTNDLCAVIYDQLTEIFKEDNYKELFKSSIPLEDATNKLKELEENGVHLLDWLKENDQNSAIETVLTKHITTAVTNDFLNFVFESLYTAKRGKMAVAYSLIRKPFSDLLFILEQVYVDKTDFIERFFHNGEPSEYDPSNNKLDKLAVIQKAISKMSTPSFFNSQHIYDMRYNKEASYGLKGITNHAVHVVTNDKNYKTKNQNLNFIFSNEEDLDRYFEHYYSTVPFLLIYAVGIIDGIIFEILVDSDNQKLKIVKEFRRLVANIILTEFTSLRTKKSNQELFNAIADKLKIRCEECGEINSIERADCELFLETEILLCCKCTNNILSTDHAIEAIEKIIESLKHS